MSVVAIGGHWGAGIPSALTYHTQFGLLNCEMLCLIRVAIFEILQDQRLNIAILISNDLRLAQSTGNLPISRLPYLELATLRHEKRMGGAEESYI